MMTTYEFVCFVVGCSIPILGGIVISILEFVEEFFNDDDN